MTALLPLAVLPLTGAASITAAAAPYAHDLIFLFMSGFILSLAMQRWELHRRMALRTLALGGTRPANIVAGFMGATAAPQYVAVQHCDGRFHSPACVSARLMLG